MRLAGLVTLWLAGCAAGPHHEGRGPDGGADSGPPVDAGPSDGAPGDAAPDAGAPTESPFLFY